MKKRNKLFAFLSVLLAGSLAACDSGQTNTVKDVQLAYENYEEFNVEDFNKDLFYVNTIQFQIADPTVIYAEHGEGAGYFYLFGTSDLINCHGFQCWRSKDLTNWEYQGVALQPDPSNTWATNNYWAPEIMYDEEYGLYFLFYNADNLNRNSATPDERYISVAYSENVAGPYIIPDNMTNQDGVELSANKPIYDFHKNVDKIPSNISIRNSAIDVSPFIDPETGKRYIYWSWYDGQQEIFGMEMKDWFTPKYETLTQVTKLNKTSMKADAEDIFDGSPALNEGPFVYYKDGTYFMTYSVYPYTHQNYQVRVAVSDNPLTGFEKIPVEDGGVLLSTDPTWKHIQSAGHHCFVKAGDELYLAYHTFYDRATINEGRAIAVDEVKFIKNSKGQLTMHANGPTYSLQPIPAVISGYKNVADQATVTATGVSANSSKEYLTDGLIKLKDSDLVKETEFDGKTQITFEFEEAVNLKAIMAYNSYNYDRSFVQIDSVELEYVGNSKGATGKATLGKIPFDFDFNSYNYRSMYPGAPAVAEFDDIPVKKVTLNINFADFNISEIKLLASTKTNATYKETFASTYEYNNTVEMNPFVNEGTVLGGTSQFEATYGWNFDNDGDSADSYVTTYGIGDSFVYFKDVITTKFYAEAYISTFSSKSYANDAYPKMGMVIRKEDACMFFYIDAANSYTNKFVGYVETTFGTSNDWDWSATEATAAVDITYRNSSLNLNNNFVKMAIIRDGAKVYLLINDVVIFEDESLRGFGANDEGSVGFLGFNSPMIVKNYSITTDSAEVDAKIAQYA